MPLDIKHPRLVESGVEIREGHLLDRSKDIPRARDDIRLFPLADRLDLWMPLFGRNVYSLGDLVLYAGFLAAILELSGRLVLNGRLPGERRFIL